MKWTFKLNSARAQAMRAGTKTHHRVPLASTEGQSISLGDTLEFVESGPHGQTHAIGTKVVTGLSTQRMEDITDQQIHAEGYANWSVMAYHWNLDFRAKDVSWDVNPEVRIIQFGDRA